MMSAPILPIANPAQLMDIPSIAGAAGTGASDAFGPVLQDAMSKVQQFQENSQQQIDKFLAGEGGELHEVALATQKAELAFEMFVQVRNKVISAYQEVMRMQL